jgi:hypothetical protein
MIWNMENVATAAAREAAMRRIERDRMKCARSLTRFLARIRTCAPRGGNVYALANAVGLDRDDLHTRSPTLSQRPRAEGARSALRYPEFIRDRLVRLPCPKPLHDITLAWCELGAYGIAPPLPLPSNSETGTLEKWRAIRAGVHQDNMKSRVCFGSRYQLGFSFPSVRFV